MIAEMGPEPTELSNTRRSWPSARADWPLLGRAGEAQTQPPAIEDVATHNGMRLRLAFQQPVQRCGFGGEELRWHGMAGPADPWPETRVYPVNSRLSEQRDACDRRPLSPLLARSWRRRDRPRHLHQQGPLPALVQLVDLCHRRGRERRRDLQPGCPPNAHDVAGQNRNPIRHPGGWSGSHQGKGSRSGSAPART